MATLLDSAIIIPRELFTDEYYKDLSRDAKMLYGILLCEWLRAVQREGDDAFNKPFTLTVEGVMSLLGCKWNKAIDTLKELQEKRLIRKKRIGQGAPNHIYVRDVFNLERMFLR